jgi:predicted MFS family arabinose efflux permease
MAGYFVCGFQVVFIGVHMPSYLKDHGLAPDVATTALALIGLFNVFGTYAAGRWASAWPSAHPGGHLRLRAVAIVVFLLVPLTPWSVYVFSAVMGCCGCPRCRPPTPSWRRSSACSTCRCWAASSSSATRSAASWACGWAASSTTCTGSYDVVWWIAVALGVFAALINLPVRETRHRARRAAPA